MPPKRMVDLRLEAGPTLFDTADVYSDGASEEILGAALKGRCERTIISTKTTACARATARMTSAYRVIT